ncbi:hypothetical protein CISG_05901 [Coccidioides immitis RMSCC 3703]|uniref:Uncharacterized protein n=2 Tax=Coccidioides immitis TaxID=5501 RepID=A0A0J8QZE4_COCIT|nr:hypothetical protein CIRG_10316 [Coccidioides immitis RMSCC 2394]KMU76758.1 hypothetical protein CISG_05901 [Coccidioides immitis RMSCC 3703]
MTRNGSKFNVKDDPAKQEVSYADSIAAKESSASQAPYAVSSKDKELCCSAGAAAGRHILPGSADPILKLLRRLNQNFTQINRLKDSLTAILESAQLALEDVNTEFQKDSSSAALFDLTPNNADDGRPAT